MISNLMVVDLLHLWRNLRRSPVGAVALRAARTDPLIALRSE
jgi:hypothetical protein